MSSRNKQPAKNKKSTITEIMTVKEQAIFVIAAILVSVCMSYTIVYNPNAIDYTRDLIIRSSLVAGLLSLIAISIGIFIKPDKARTTVLRIAITTLMICVFSIIIAYSAHLQDTFIKKMSQ